MAHFFERDDLPGVSGKIIEEHGSEYYRCEIDGQKYPVKYELIRPSGFDYRTGAKQNPQSTSTRSPRLVKADYVQQLGYYEPGYTKDFCTMTPALLALGTSFEYHSWEILYVIIDYVWTLFFLLFNF